MPEDRKKPLVFANTKGMERADWLKVRKAGIGGSDAASILGMNPYSSPLSVWADKTSEADQDDEQQSESIWLGYVLEDHVAKRFARESGMVVERCNKMLQHPDHPFMLANIDRRVKGKNIGIEIKTTSMNTKTDFDGGEINRWYYCQCMHYLAVTGWDRWILVVLVIGKGMYTFEIERNEEEIEALIGAEKDFWERYVIPRKMPAADGTEASETILMQRFPESNGLKCVLSCDDAIQQYAKLCEQIKALERDRDIYKQSIMEQMGDYEIGETANYTVSWKSSKPRATFDSKQLAKDHPDIYEQYIKQGAPSRRFTVKETKGA